MRTKGKPVEPEAVLPIPPMFQVRGEEQQYEGVDAAIRRARKKGRGSVVIRVSDGEVMATVPGWLSKPKDMDDIPIEASDLEVSAHGMLSHLELMKDKGDKKPNPLEVFTQHLATETAKAIHQNGTTPAPQN